MWLYTMFWEKQGPATGFLYNLGKSVFNVSLSFPSLRDGPQYFDCLAYKAVCEGVCGADCLYFKSTALSTVEL